MKPYVFGFFIPFAVGALWVAVDIRNAVLDVADELHRWNDSPQVDEQACPADGGAGAGKGGAR